MSNFEFTRLADVEKIETMSEEASVLVENEGAVKRVPAGSIIPDSGLPEGAGANQQLVTDADGVEKWDERLAYEYTKTTFALFPAEAYREPTEKALKFTGTRMVFGDGYNWSSFGIDAEKTYTVEFDKTVYENVSVYAYNDSNGYALECMGNSGLHDEGADSIMDEYPFFIGSNGTGTWNVYATEEGEHTLSVYASEQIVKPVDAKFIPDTVANKTDILSRTHGRVRLPAGGVSFEWDGDYESKTPAYSYEVDEGTNYLYAVYSGDIDPLCVATNFEVFYGEDYTALEQKYLHPDEGTISFEDPRSSGASLLLSVFDGKTPFYGGGNTALFTPEAGIYLTRGYNLRANLAFCGNAHSGTAKLPEKFIPDIIQRVGDDVLLTSPGGTQYKLTVSDDGTLSAAAVE